MQGRSHGEKQSRGKSPLRSRVFGPFRPAIRLFHFSERRLGRKGRIVSGKRKGRIELEYYGQDDLQQLYDALHTIRKKEQH